MHLLVFVAAFTRGGLIRHHKKHPRWSCVIMFESFTLSYLHHAYLEARSPEGCPRSSLNVVAHVLNWCPARLRHVKGVVGKRSSLIIIEMGEQSMQRFSPVNSMFIPVDSVWAYCRGLFLQKRILLLLLSHARIVILITKFDKIL